VVGLLLDCLQEIALDVRDRAGLVHQDDIHKALDGVQGWLQRMGNNGKEVRLHPFQFFLAGDITQDGGDAL